MKKYILVMITAILLLTTLGTAMAEGKDCWYYAQNGTHDFEQTDVGYASCKQDGYYIIECRQCGYSHKEITEYARGHNLVQTELVYASCTQDGYFKGECTECDYTEKEITQRAYGHNWVETHREMPGSSTYGIIIEACTNCNQTRSEKIYPDGTLMRGSKDSDGVKELQLMLIDCGYLNDKMDGIFGKNTEAAVKAFQKAVGLNADGIAWPQTIQRLEKEWEQRMNDTPSAPIVAAGTPEPEVPQNTDIFYSPFCYSWEDANGTMVTQQCEKHAKMWETTLNLLADDTADSALYSYSEWQAEIIRLYNEWSNLVDGEARQHVENSKALCITMMNSQLKVMQESYALIGTEILPSDVYYGAELWMRSHSMWLCQMLNTLGVE